MKVPLLTARRASNTAALRRNANACSRGLGRRCLSSTVVRLEKNDDSSADGSKGMSSFDIAAFLSSPSWSVSSLLPPKDLPDREPPITSKQLHHLLRLSALPPPSSPEEEKSMMSDLAAQLHFVKEMQKVDTTGIEPLRVIRDETAAAEKEQEITLDTLKEALAKEEVVGKHYKRIRRTPDAAADRHQWQPSGWDPLSHATKKSGKFFVVDSGKGDGA